MEIPRKKKKRKKEKTKEDLINKALEIALDTRKFEIELYWKRTGYFVLFIGAIFVGYYNVFFKFKITLGIFIYCCFRLFIISFMVYGKSRE